MVYYNWFIKKWVCAPCRPVGCHLKIKFYEYNAAQFLKSKKLMSNASHFLMSKKLMFNAIIIANFQFLQKKKMSNAAHFR